MAQNEPGTNSKRSTAYVKGATPTHFVKGQGPYVWDMTGKKYIDFVCGLGTNLLGHNHPKVTQEVLKAINQGGPSFSQPNPYAVEVAEILRTMVPCAEKIRFLKTGSEATTAAIRIARAATGLWPVLSEGYHGWHDEFVSLTEPALGVTPHGYISETEGDHYICEPIALDATEARRQKLAHKMVRNGLNIFDEVVTGFRVPKWSVSRMWDLKPDLICLGKAIANGYALSVVAGKKEVMDSCEYFVSSTYSDNTIELAAAKATLETLQKKKSEDLWYYANRFMDSLNERLALIDLKIEGYGVRGMFPVTAKNGAEFMQEASDQGLHFGKAFFYGYQHMELMHEEATLQIVGDVVEKIAKGKVNLRGERPVESFKR